MNQLDDANVDQQMQEALDNVSNYLDQEQKNEIAPESSSDQEEELQDSPSDENEGETTDHLTIDPDEQERILAKRKLSKLKRERHRLAVEAQKLKEENEALRSYMEHSNQAAMSHYDKNVNMRIENAKKEKLKALEIGDMEAVVEADQQLAEAIADLKSIQSWKTQEALRNQSQQQQQRQSQDYYEEPEVEVNAETEQWIAANPWFNPNSASFDADMFEDVNDYIASLDEHLARTGKQNQQFSRAYFNKINAYVKDAYGISQKRPQPMVMQKASQYVEPVRNRSSVANTPRKETIRLSEDEKRMAANLGVSEEAYLIHKKQDMEKQKARGVTSGYR